MGGQVDSSSAAIDRDVDASRPSSTISAVLYDESGSAPVITLTGTGFNSIESATTDIKAQLDWTKFNWDY